VRALARRRASRSSGASALLLLGLLVVPSEAGAAEEAVEPIAFEYAAAGDCPSAEDVLRQIAAYTPKWTLARPGDEARRFVLRIGHRNGSYVGRFELHEAGGRSAERNVTDDSCEDVALGLAIAVALAIDPGARMGGEPPSVDRPEPSPLPPPASQAPPDAEAPAVVVAPPAIPEKPAPPPRPPSSAAVSVGARGEATSAVSGLLAVMGPYLELEWNPAPERLPWFRPVFRAGFRQSFTRTTRVGPTEAEIAWSAGQVEVCPSRFLLASRFSVEGCLASNVGVLSAQARGIPGAGITRRAWFDYGVLVAARWQFHPSLFAETVGAVWVPQTRDRLRVEPDGVVTEAPAAGLSAGLGIGWRF
jgi:hypothetical protein